MPLLTRSRGSPIIPTNFPPEVRFIVKSPGAALVAVVEDAPQLRSILYKVGKNSSDTLPHRFLIRKPWSYLLVQYSNVGFARYDSCNLWFSRKRIESLADPGLLAAPMPNVIYNTVDLTPHYRCCMGLWRYYSPDAVRLPTDTHLYFWSSVFNDEYGDAKSKFIPPELEGSTAWKDVLETWQKLKVEPGWKTVELPNCAPVRTLDEALRASYVPQYEIL